MEFVIHYKKNSGKKLIPFEISEFESTVIVSDQVSIALFESKPELHLIRFSTEEFEFLIFGDLIFDKRIRNNESEKIHLLREAMAQKSFHKMPGFFYVIAIDKIKFQIEVYSGFFNILPLYYYQDTTTVMISTSIRNFLDYSKKKLSFSEKYAVERILFYYSFENNTLFNQINLISTCSYIEISNDAFLIKNAYSCLDFYVSHPESQRRSLDRLSDLFLNEFENFLPEKPATVSLTGGFDGRTILSAAIKNGYLPNTFSYGTDLESDILIPELIAESLNFHHHKFLLTRDYAKESFWDDGLEFIKATDFTGNISRAHYVYVAKELSKKFSFLLSGNFGSELLRSVKTPGVMVSPALFALFRIDKKNKFEEYVQTIPGLKYLNSETIKKELPGIINHVWDYKNNLPPELTSNQKFYTYIFTEVFRKYFGPEIVFQSNYIMNRSPFLGYKFIKELLKTNNAGAYSGFDKNNPFSRFNGQVLYSQIMKKSCEKLLSFPLDKGYKPGDFLTYLGKLQISKGYIIRKIKTNKSSKCPSYSKNYYNENKAKIKESIVKSPFLNVDFLKEEIENKNGIQDHINFVNVLSLDISYGLKV